MIVSKRNAKWTMKSIIEKNKIINESKNVIKLNQNKPIEKNMCAVLAISYTTIQNPKMTNWHSINPGYLIDSIDYQGNAGIRKMDIGITD